MPNVLAVAPGTPHALEGRSLLGGHLAVEVFAAWQNALRRGEEAIFDLLVLFDMSVDEQQRVAAEFQQHRRWRLVPVLYVTPTDTLGIAIPGGYRPEMDSIVRGELQSPAVLKRIQAMARESIGQAEMVVAGPYELDPVRGRLTLAKGHDVVLTEREAEIVSILLAHPNRTVPAREIIERGWGADADDRYLQILRRHVSNIRRKLAKTPAERSVRTVRGSGYRFDIRNAG